MAAIAAEADVALKTLYLAFAGKSDILSSLWDVVLRGGEDGAPVGQQPWYREVIEEPDAARQLRLNARNSRRVKERINPVVGSIRSVAASDPDIEALWNRIQTTFYDNQRLIVASIDAKGALRPGLDVTRAADILWTLNHPDVWLLLVGQRGWTPEAYEQWFAETACAQLLNVSSVGAAAP
jgi:AcrR family transcriptional regulator